jgi:hypothetical protein
MEIGDVWDYIHLDIDAEGEEIKTPSSRVHIILKDLTKSGTPIHGIFGCHADGQKFIKALKDKAHLLPPSRRVGQFECRDIDGVYSYDLEKSMINIRKTSEEKQHDKRMMTDDEYGIEQMRKECREDELK